MNIRDYPRPQNDNGIGMHFRLDLREDDNHPFISEGVKWLQLIHAKWALIAGGDWLQIGKAAPLIWAAGIMPICRLVCKIDRPFIDWEDGVKTMLDLGIPPYIQVFNEPGDDREWNHHPNIQSYGQRWADAAARVFDAGGLPGIQVLGLDEWQAAYEAVKANNRMDIWDKAWFCLHNAGINHPPLYPYDDVNLHGTPVDEATYAQFQWGASFEQVNEIRQKSAKPDATIMTDDTAVLRFLEYRQWMLDSLGFSLPIIGGEAGWSWGANDDLRYPKIDENLHADYHKGMYEWFMTGVIPTGQPLPDELFSVSDWIMADGGAESWWFGPLGTKQKTIDAVTSIPIFVRRFSWDMDSSLPAPSGEVSTVPSGEGGVNVGTPDQPTDVILPTGTSAAVTALGVMESMPELAAPEEMLELPASTKPLDLPASPELPEMTPASEDVGSAVNAQLEESTMLDEPPSDKPTITYFVQQGETLWGVSKKFGTTVDALISANDLEENTKLRAGQNLVIPR